MSRSRGFTLIEVMITVAVIGILSAIAYPSYVDHLRKSRRAEAQSLLMDIAMRQQQFLLDARKYGATVSTLNITVPTTVSTFYTIDVSAPDTSSIPTFSATATPKGDQLSDKCGTLGVSQTGVKTAVKGGSAVSGCW